MIRIENIELEMKVLSKQGVGTVKSIWFSDANRCYAVVELGKGNTIDVPIDLLIKWNSLFCYANIIILKKTINKIQYINKKNYL